MKASKSPPIGSFSSGDTVSTGERFQKKSILTDIKSKTVPFKLSCGDTSHKRVFEASLY
jgi:hypothetical protein